LFADLHRSQNANFQPPTIPNNRYNQINFLTQIGEHKVFSGELIGFKLNFRNVPLPNMCARDEN
jgi:hypothetical protein